MYDVSEDHHLGIDADDSLTVNVPLGSLCDWRVVPTMIARLIWFTVLVGSHSGTNSGSLTGYTFILNFFYV